MCGEPGDLRAAKQAFELYDGWLETQRMQGHGMG